MRMLMTVKMATGEFNAAVKNGNAGKIMNRILEECRPEAAYFTDDPSQIPRFAEPWFLNFNASIQFKIAMTQEDLRKSGLDEIGKKWS